MKGALNEQKSEHLGEEEGTPDKSKRVMRAGSGHAVHQSSPGGMGFTEGRQGMRVGKASRVRPLSTEGRGGNSE